MIILASDHAGYPLKEEIKKFFNRENIIAIDVGCYSKEQLDDYPDFAKAANVKVTEDPRNVGIYICGSGIGMSIVANRHPKIRAALCQSEKFAELSRRHNDANVLCLPGRFISARKAIKIIKVFLTTDFEGGRHSRRIKKY
ncbi:MAG: ribose 5-phosphate isomerase B [Clostridia bacterium]|jgi:ribose 5-phosphate isomerase B|nr:ribose 5-phosphate isomerase B [Clostridia bacterium]